jgi:hypothetical protein
MLATLDFDVINECPCIRAQTKRVYRKVVRNLVILHLELLFGHFPKNMTVEERFPIFATRERVARGREPAPKSLDSRKLVCQFLFLPRFYKPLFAQLANLLQE